jgi:hypothetical protein
MKSGRLAVNILIDLANKEFEPKATFDFVKRTIAPDEANSKESNQLMNDYLNWLPDHFKSHNCDLDKLEKLQITIWTSFDKAITPKGMNNSREILVRTLTKWKANGRDEQTIEITHTEVIKANYLKLRIPEIK